MSYTAPQRLAFNEPGWLDTVAAWLLALLWVLPLLYAIWTAFHPAEYATRFELGAPLTLDNFRRAWAAAPFARYLVNTTLLVGMILTVQLVLATLAAYAFARYRFAGRNLVFALVLVQLMVMPDILVVENYKTMARLGLVDTLWAIGLPYFASAFAIFLLRQTFMGIPKELDDAARVEGASALQTLWRVYVPLARPTYTAFALVSVSFHWNNFLWPLIVTSTADMRTLPIGISWLLDQEGNTEWGVVMAATLFVVVPVVLVFLYAQRFLVSGIAAGAVKG